MSLPRSNYQRKKEAPVFLTGIANMLIEANSHGFECCYDPRELTTVTFHGVPVRTLARRVDGAFPSTINPIAVWEIKEYYYTTAFGSRVADGVYETLLDGMELEELREKEGIDIKHYLLLDARYTWWDCGRSYLCRVIDMLHMGYVDEVLFGPRGDRSTAKTGKRLGSNGPQARKEGLVSRMHLGPLLDKSIRCGKRGTREEKVKKVSRLNI